MDTAYLPTTAEDAPGEIAAPIPIHFMFPKGAAALIGVKAMTAVKLHASKSPLTRNNSILKQNFRLLNWMSRFISSIGFIG